MSQVPNPTNSVSDVRLQQVSADDLLLDLPQPALRSVMDKLHSDPVVPYGRRTVRSPAMDGNVRRSPAEMVDGDKSVLSVGGVNNLDNLDSVGAVARSEFNSRWNAAVAREAKWTARDLEVEQLEKQLSIYHSNRAPNWPRKFLLCVRPMVHHNIAEEILVPRQKLVHVAYVNYIATIFLLVANTLIVLSLSTLANQPGRDSSPSMIQHVVVAVLQLLGIPLAFFVWYWPTYQSCATGACGTYRLAFCGLAMACLFNVVQMVGPIGYGGAGGLYAKEIFVTKGSVAAVAPAVVTAFWFLQLLGFFYVIHGMRGFFSVDMATLAAAKKTRVDGG